MQQEVPVAGSHVVSVTGPVPVERLGVVDAHDHLFMDSPGMPGQAFSDVERTVEEVEEGRRRGSGRSSR